MIDVTFEAPDTFKAYRQQLEQTPQAVKVFLNGTVRGHLQKQADARLGRIPGPVKLPILWAPAFTQNKVANVRLPGIAYYSKQKAAFFATNGFGRGIGAPRTNKIAKSWEVIVDINQSVVGFVNTSPSSIFVIGRRQQRFHENTGWRREDEIALDILTSVDIEDMLIDGWLSIVDIGNSLK